MKAIGSGIRNAIGWFDLIFSTSVGLCFAILYHRFSVFGDKWFFVIDGLPINQNGQFEYVFLGLWLTFLFAPFSAIGKVRDNNYVKGYFYLLRLDGIKNLCVYSTTICVTKAIIYCAINEIIIGFFSPLSLWNNLNHYITTYLLISTHMCLLVVSYLFLTVICSRNVNVIILLMLVESVTFSVAARYKNLTMLMPGTWGMYRIFENQEITIGYVLLIELCLIFIILVGTHFYWNYKKELLEA